MYQVRQLGRGQFGSVWLARWRGVDVALKEHHGTTDSQQNEVRVTRQLCCASCVLRAVPWCAARAVHVALHRCPFVFGWMHRVGPLSSPRSLNDGPNNEPPINPLKAD